MRKGGRSSLVLIVVTPLTHGIPIAGARARRDSRSARAKKLGARLKIFIEAAGPRREKPSSTMSRHRACAFRWNRALGSGFSFRIAARTQTPGKLAPAASPRGRWALKIPSHTGAGAADRGGDVVVEWPLKALRN